MPLELTLPIASLGSGWSDWCAPSCFFVYAHGARDRETDSTNHPRALALLGTYVSSACAFRVCSQTVGSSGGHSIYKLQGRNPDLTLARTGNAKKKIVSTSNEKTEKGVTWHEYYHVEMLQRDGTVLDKDKFWYREQDCIKDAPQLNQLLLNQWGRHKVRRPFILAPRS